MGTSKILYKFGLAKTLDIRISSTLPQSSAIAFKDEICPNLGHRAQTHMKIPGAHRLTYVSELHPDAFLAGFVLLAGDVHLVDGFPLAHFGHGPVA